MVFFILPASGLNVLERRRGLWIVAKAFHINGNGVLQLGQLGPGFQHLVGLLLILTHHNACIAVFENVGHFIPGTGRVHPNTDAPHHANTHLGDHPFHPVFRDDGHVATLLQPHGAQPQTKLPGAVVVVPPGIGLPDAKVFLTQGQGIRPFLRMGPQHLGQGQIRQGRCCHDSHRLRRL